MSKVLFILDEMPSLGHLPCIEDAVDKYRGYGVRLICLFQSVGQLRKCFPDGQEQTLLSNTTQVFFGVNDQQTAELVSSRLGEETIVVTSGGSSRGTSSSTTQGMQGSHTSGGSWNANDNWQQQPRKLLKPEEVVALPPRMAITFTPGVPPILTTLLRYYEEPGLGRPPKRMRRLWSAWLTLIVSAVLCGLSVTFAAKLTLAIDRRTKAAGWNAPDAGSYPRPQRPPKRGE